MKLELTRRAVEQWNTYRSPSPLTRDWLAMEARLAQHEALTAEVARLQEKVERLEEQLTDSENMLAEADAEREKGAAK